MQALEGITSPPLVHRSFVLTAEPDGCSVQFLSSSTMNIAVGIASNNVRSNRLLEFIATPFAPGSTGLLEYSAAIYMLANGHSLYCDFRSRTRFPNVCSFPSVFSFMYPSRS